MELSCCWSDQGRDGGGVLRLVKPSALVLQKITKLSSDRDCRQNNFLDNRMHGGEAATRGPQIKKGKKASIEETAQHSPKVGLN